MKTENKTGERIKEARKKRGLTQQELADATGLAKGTIQQYENGKRSPKSENLMIIANVLHTPLWEIDDPNEITDLGALGFYDVLSDLFDSVSEITVDGQKCYVFSDGNKNYYLPLVSYYALYNAIKPFIKQFVTSPYLFSVAVDAHERLDEDQVSELIKKSWSRYD